MATLLDRCNASSKSLHVLHRFLLDKGLGHLYRRRLVHDVDQGKVAQVADVLVCPNRYPADIRLVDLCPVRNVHLPPAFCYQGLHNLLRGHQLLLANVYDLNSFLRAHVGHPGWLACAIKTSPGKTCR